MRATLLNGNPLFRQTAGGLKFTSVSGKLTLDEAAVFGSTGVIRIIYLIDLCQLYHGYDQTDQLKNNACFIGLKHIIRGVMNMKKYFMPVGKSDFGKIREDGDYYIDKTGLIEQIIVNNAEVTLFTHPRRFGKNA